MGGRSYFCDYCRCYLKNDLNVRKTHNAGLMHNIAKANYLRRYEDPRKILEEEKAKSPCIHYSKGYCKFGLFCQYSHYNPMQLKELEEIAVKLQKRTNDTSEPQANNKRKTKQRRKGKHKKLPPSLRALNTKRLMSVKICECHWG